MVLGTDDGGFEYPLIALVETAESDEQGCF
jgi:hypothetical protein